MTRQEIIDELQSIEYQLDSGHITDAQSNLNLLKDNLERLEEDKPFGGDTGIDADISNDELYNIEIDGCWNGKNKESFNGIRISNNTIYIYDYDVCS